MAFSNAKIADVNCVDCISKNALFFYLRKFSIATQNKTNVTNCMSHKKQKNGYPTTSSSPSRHNDNEGREEIQTLPKNVKVKTTK